MPSDSHVIMPSAGQLSVSIWSFPSPCSCCPSLGGLGSIGIWKPRDFGHWNQSNPLPASEKMGSHCCGAPAAASMLPHDYPLCCPGCWLIMSTSVHTPTCSAHKLLKHGCHCASGFAVNVSTSVGKGNMSPTLTRLKVAFHKWPSMPPGVLPCQYWHIQPSLLSQAYTPKR